jgi:hypothetical protein
MRGNESKVRTTSLVILLCIGTSGTVSCRQNVTLPKSGTSAAEVKKNLGEPNTTDRESREQIRVYLHRFPDCAGADENEVVAVWAYTRTLRKAVLVLVDGHDKVVCSGHGGVVFID